MFKYKSLFNSRKLNTKILLSFSIFFGALIALAGSSYFIANNAITKLVNDNLTEALNGAYNSIDLSYTGNINRQKDEITTLFSHVANKTRLDDKKTVTLTVTNQISKESKKITIPEMKINGESVNHSHELADMMSANSGEAVTIFQVFDGGLLRISTTVKKEDGSRAVGTFIPIDSPVYKSIIEKKEYYGRAFVVNKWYVVGYKPILESNSKKVIGALFVGLPDENLSAIRDLYHSKVLGKTGYIYVLDLKGNLIIHPKLEGKNLYETQDDKGNYFIKEMCTKKNGIIRYPWKNPGETIARDKIVFYKYIPSLEWVVAAGSYLDEFYSPIYLLQYFMSVISAILILLMVVVFIWLVRSMKAISNELITNANAISYGSQEISKGNMNLSQRTQEQASTLEETAATMEQITERVKQTADNALHATKLVRGTVEAANQGNAVAENTKKAMAEISESSSKISEIVNLVNEIAFQTNILALNAAIEATKAGDFGRGFAVVATEIRMLAQRSATAANEIKDLISESLEKVQNGTKFVDESTKKLTEIAKDIGKVSMLIQGISDAAREEETGIEQINMVVTQLDTVTQQNAALVEETASAAENMSSETKKMEALIRERLSASNKDAMYFEDNS
jgi:methyl-accepting chemotaxis protein